MLTANLLPRRDFLQLGAAAGAALCLGNWNATTARADVANLGFKLGLQSYSLRGYKQLDKALEVSKSLGIKFWEAYPGHIPATTLPNVIKDYQAKLTANEVKVLAFGVVGFDADEKKARSVFEFAKAMGIETLSANPKKDEATFKMLDKLVDEFAINIAIHNHGPKALYDKIDDVVNAVKDHHPRIGACVDTGHYLRSQENPVNAVEKLKGRVFGVHLKDVKDAKVFKILGEGDLDLVGLLKVLKAQNYQHVLALEYEEHPDAVVPDIELCLKNLRSAFAKVSA